MARSTPFARTLSLALGMALSIGALAFAGPAAAHRHGGFDDGPAGTIAAFDAGTGKLTIDLAKGGSISGVVTERTWIESGESCDRHDRRQLHDWCRASQLHHSEHGDDHGGHHDFGSADDLVAGAVVDDALLVLKDGRAWFAKIDLDG